MIIAVAYENGQIFQHFGQTEQFKVYEVENGAIKNTVIVKTNGKSHEALAGYLKDIGADVLICGGMGGGAYAAVTDLGIELYSGNTGSADEAVSAYLAEVITRKAAGECGNCGSSSLHS